MTQKFGIGARRIIFQRPLGTLSELFRNMRGQVLKTLFTIYFSTFSRNVFCQIWRIETEVNLQGNKTLCNLAKIKCVRNFKSIG